MKKRIISSLLALTLAVSIIPLNPFEAKVIDAAGTDNEAYILCYTRENDDSVKGRSGGKNGMYQSATTDSMHLAYSTDGVNFEALIITPEYYLQKMTEMLPRLLNNHISSG